MLLEDLVFPIIPLKTDELTWDVINYVMERVPNLVTWEERSFLRDPGKIFRNMGSSIFVRDIVNGNAEVNIDAVYHESDPRFEGNTLIQVVGSFGEHKEKPHVLFNYEHSIGTTTPNEDGKSCRPSVLNPNVIGGSSWQVYTNWDTRSPLGKFVRNLRYDFSEDFDWAIEQERKMSFNRDAIIKKGIDANINEALAILDHVRIDYQHHLFGGHLPEGLSPGDEIKDNYGNTWIYSAVFNNPVNDFRNFGDARIRSVNDRIFVKQIANNLGMSLVVPINDHGDYAFLKKHVESVEVK